MERLNGALSGRYRIEREPGEGGMATVVMAVFRQPVDGLRAVAHAQSRLSASDDERGRLRLKAGIHYGPCIAVTMNERLD